MQIPVLVEPLPDGRGFLARAGEPFGISAEGSTREAALHEVERLTRNRLVGGAEVVPLQLGTGNAWSDLTGFLPDDQLTRNWMDILRENRRKANEAEDGLLPGA